MSKDSYLVLEDGTVYAGRSFGSNGTSFGEVVFNTSMTGYQEVLTDPSYAGQIVVLTYPLIGNYGISRACEESKGIQVAAFVVREHATYPSHVTSESAIGDYLSGQSIPGLSQVDTRAITRRLRSSGVMMGCVTTEYSTGEALSRIREIPRYDDLDLVKTVSTGKLYQWGNEFNSSMDSENIHIVVSDCGLKFNILRCLLKRGCSVTVVPAHISAGEILGLKPDGVIFSPGPGDPVHQGLSVSILRELMGRIPIMGICLGHQLLAKACGAKTFKLKFGHRGGNHPVRDITTGRVHITAQNHGYAVDTDSLPAGLEASHVNLNDGTLEGVVHTEYPMMGIQFHSEASPGPLDNGYLFDRFLSMVKEVV